MRPVFLACAIIGMSVASVVAADPPVPIRPSLPMKGGEDLGTKGYQLLPDEEPFFKKITEKEIILWDAAIMPRPENMPDEEWRKMEEERIEKEKKMIRVKNYELKKQEGEYVGWFGIVRGSTYDEAADRTILRLEHKYFDGLTDLHLHIVSIYGAGDFQVTLPGRITAKEIPLLSLVCAYGKVTDEPAVATVKADYVRLWDWGLFTFMDYGLDKSNPDWVKLRKTPGEDAYSPRPDTDYYVKLLGERK